MNEKIRETGGAASPLAAALSGLRGTAAEPGDYTGEDGLLYCGKCHTPKEAFFRPEYVELFGRDRHPARCACRRRSDEERELAEQQRRHAETVARLKKDCFDTPGMQEWCFARDNGENPKMDHAKYYVSNFDSLYVENTGYLLWGGVGTGKSFFAACIANALMEKEIPVRMTNLALVLNDLTGCVEGRNAYISRLCSYSLLILDDFGMERGTEYALEQVYNVIDSRYRSGRPLIVTTNLSLDEMRSPKDTAHSRIYDRLLAMCSPILFSGTSLRRQTAQSKLNRLRGLSAEQ